MTTTDHETLDVSALDRLRAGTHPEFARAHKPLDTGVEPVEAVTAVVVPTVIAIPTAEHPVADVPTVEVPPVVGPAVGPSWVTQQAREYMDTQDEIHLHHRPRFRFPRRAR